MKVLRSSGSVVSVYMYMYILYIMCISYGRSAWVHIGICIYIIRKHKQSPLLPTGTSEYDKKSVHGSVYNNIIIIMIIICTHAKREILHALRRKNDSADRVTVLYFATIIMIYYAQNWCITRRRVRDLVVR